MQMTSGLNGMPSAAMFALLILYVSIWAQEAGEPRANDMLMLLISIKQVQHSKLFGKSGQKALNPQSRRYPQTQLAD